MFEPLRFSAKLVPIAVFFALVIDAMDFQMLALSLPAISNELHLSSLNAPISMDPSCGAIGFSSIGAEA